MSVGRPQKFDDAFTLRVDKDFRAAVGDLQRWDDGDNGVPSMSDVIRAAVMEVRERKRKERRK